MKISTWNTREGELIFAKGVKVRLKLFKCFIMNYERNFEQFLIMADIFEDSLIGLTNS